MKRLPVLMLAFLCIWFGAELGRCQGLVGNEQGLLPYGSYHGGNVDSVNLENGNLTIRIPLFSLPQKGKLSLSYSLVLNNQAFGHTEFCDDPSLPSGQCYWQYVQSAPIGPLLVMDQAVNLQQAFTPLPEMDCVGPCTGYSVPAPQDSVVDATGGSHALLYDSANTPLLYAVDGSGYAYQTAFTQANFQPWAGNPIDPNLSCSSPDNLGTLMGTVYTPDGISHTYDDACVSSQVDPVLDISEEPSYPIEMKDRSGNKITYSIWSGDLGYTFPGGVTDSVGRAIPDFYQLPYDVSPSARCKDLGVPSQPLKYSKTWVVPGPNGGTSTYTFCMTVVIYNTLFGGGSPGILQTQAGEYYEPQAIGSSIAIQSVVLPNGTYWGFIYDSDSIEQFATEEVDGYQYPDPTVTPRAEANLTKLILPTGGTVSYEYSQYEACDRTGATKDYVEKRTVDDLNGNSALWQYAYDNTAGVVINSDGTDTVVPSTTAVTDPYLNDTVHTYTNPPEALNACSYRLETEVQQYNGAAAQNNVLKTTTTTYANTAFISNNANPLAYNQEPTLSTEALSGGVVKRSSLSYPALVTLDRPICNYEPDISVSDCPWSPGPEQIAVEYDQPSTIIESLSDNSLSNEIDTVYKYQSDQSYRDANLLSLVSSVITTNKLTNKQASKTTYGYDENNGSPQGVYGSLTSTTRWVDTSNEVQTETIYNSEGMPTRQIDADNYPTEISYQCSGSLPYQVTNPAGQTTTYGYDCNTGHVTSVQDPNDTAANRPGTVYTYNSFGDLQNISYPDGGSTSVGYHGYGSPLHITTTQAADPDPAVVQDLYYDGLARAVKSTRAGATVDTAYDLVGSIASVSNPHGSASASTDGVTSYAYDALGRKTLQCEPDNGSSSGSCEPGSAYLEWDYHGDTIDYYDATRHHWQRTLDALGRVTKVLEPDSSNRPVIETDYSYDPLGNLTQVDQWGGQPGGVGERLRSFTYDELSRLVTATNSESGSTCYGTWSGATCTNGYDGDGNLLAKTDARGIVTNYRYDSLNRLLSKRSSDSTTVTPSACYQYDQSSQADTMGNTISRLVNEWTQSADANGGTCATTMPTSGTTLLTSKSILLYDPMGRIKKEQTCVYPTCTATMAQYPMRYGYDLAGNILSYTNGNDPVQYTNNYDAAGRLSRVTSTLTAQKYPSPLFSYPTYNPAGGLSGAIYGAGTGVALCRWYDKRLRIVGESDASGSVSGSSACPAVQPQ